MNFDPLIIAAGTIIAALIGVRGTVFAIRKQKKEAERQLAIDMYQEFDSGDMLKDRFRAAELIREEIRHSDVFYIDDMYKNKNRRSEYIPLSRVLHFWERLSHLMEGGLVDREVVKVVFKRDYKKWRDDFLVYLKTRPGESDLLTVIGRLDCLLLDCPCDSDEDDPSPQSDHAP